MYSVDDLNREIITAVEGVWNDDDQPLLISKLGKDFLSDDGRAFLREESIALGRHIKGRLAGEIRYLKMPREGGGVVPLEKTKNLTDEELERKYVPKRKEQIEWAPPPKFYEDLWAAFRDPLAEGLRRVVHWSESGRPEVVVKPKDEPLSEGDFAIDSHDTAITSDSDKKPNAAEVRTAITNWAEVNGISLEKMTYSPASRLTSARRPPSALPRDASDTLPSFVGILRTMSRDQITRLSFPGDVMLHILERHIKK